MKINASWILAVVMLVGCSAPTETPTLPIVDMTDTPQPTAVPPTPTRRSTRTPTPTHSSTLTPTVEPTVTQLPYLTPAPTFTPNLTPTQPPSAMNTLIPQPDEIISLENAKDVVELARLGKGVVRNVEYSADGRYLGIDTASDKYLYNTSAFTALQLTSELWNDAFPQDGDALTALASETGVQIVRVRDNKVLSKITTDGFLHTPVVFSPDWKLAVAGINSSQLGVWQTADGELLHTLELSWEIDSFCGSITAIAFSPDGTMIAAGCEEFGLVYIWQVFDGSLYKVLDSQDWVVFSVAFSEDGKYLAAMETGGRIGLWRIEDGTRLHTFSGSRLLWWVTSGARMDFSPNGTQLVAGYPNGEVLVFDLRNRVLLNGLHGVAPSGESVSFSQDGQLLAVGASDSIRVFQAANGLPMPISASLRGISSPVSYNLAPAVRSGPSYAVTGVTISPNGEMLAATFMTWDVSLKLWDINSNQLTSVDTVPQVNWSEIHFSPNGEMIAAGLDAGNAIELREVKGWEVLNTFAFLNQDFATDFTFSNDGQNLLAVSYWGNVYLWRLDSKEPLLSFNINDENAFSVALSLDGENIAVGGRTNLEVFSARDGSVRYLIQALSVADPNSYVSIHSVVIYDVVFSPDSQIIASALSTGDIQLWNANDGSLLRTLRHNGPVLSLTFSRDGKYLASGSQDGTVRIWGIQP